MMSLLDHRGLRFGGCAALLVAVLGLGGCSEEKQAEAKAVIRPVKTVTVAQSGQSSSHYSGAVRARVEMNLGFRVAGKIVERMVDAGERVNPGDVLARLDPTDYRLQVKTAEANLAAAEQAVATAELSKRRADQLFEREVTSKSQKEQAALGYAQAVSERDAAIAALNQARNQVGYADLTATQSGIVTAIAADVGAVVSAGTPVVTVAVDGEKEVQIAVPETDIARFATGKAVKAGFWADPGLVLDGKVREISGSADTQSRTFAVRVSLPADERVRLGTTATISAEADSGPGSVEVPLAALSQKDGQKIVWTVDRQAETVKARPVTLGPFTDKGVIVSTGLQPGDLVVAAGTQFMQEGLKVKLSAEQQTASAAVPALR